MRIIASLLQATPLAGAARARPCGCFARLQPIASGSRHYAIPSAPSFARSHVPRRPAAIEKEDEPDATQPIRDVSRYQSSLARNQADAENVRIEEEARMVQEIKFQQTSALRPVSDPPISERAARRAAWRAANSEPSLADRGKVFPNLRRRLRSKDTTSALVLAHQFLNATAVGSNQGHELEVADGADGSLLPSAADRAETYRILLNLFLRHPKGAAPSRSLLARQTAEGIPIAPEIAVLALKHGRAPISVLFPFLPEPAPPDLLAIALHGLINSAGPAPDDVHEAVTQYLKGQGVSSGENDWDWALWGALIASYVPQVDFVGSLKTLGRFKNLVLKAREEALSSGREWPDDRAGIVQVAYTTVMGIWSTSRFTESVGKQRRNRFGSPVPSHLSSDLQELLAPRDKEATPTSLPLPFLNAWINAERIAGNARYVNAIWPYIAGQSIRDTVAGVPPPTGSPHPTAESYVALLKFLKLDPPPSYRPLAARILADTKQADTTGVLNALLAAVAAPQVRRPSATGTWPTTVPDLPLLLFLLVQRPARLDSRSIDLVGAAIIRAARAGVAPVRGLPRQGGGWRRISLHDWEWLTEAASSRMPGDAAEKRRIILPLSQPRAVAETTDSEDVPDTSAEEPMVETHRGLYTGQRDKTVVIKAFLPVLCRLLGAAIIVGSRAIGATGDAGDMLANALQSVEVKISAVQAALDESNKSS